MTYDFGSLVGMARDSVGNPRGIARRLMAENLPMDVRWLAFAAVVVVSVLLAYGSLLLLAVPTDGQIGGAIGLSPLGSAVMQGAAMLVIAIAIAKGGAAFGGRGSFADALLLVTFAEFVMALLQALQIVLTLLFPFAAMLVGMVGIAILFWQLTQFTMELHGFTSPVKVFLGILAGFFVAAFLLVAVLEGMGLGPGHVGV